MILITDSVLQMGGMITSEPERSNIFQKLKPENSEDVIPNMNYKLDPV